MSGNPEPVVADTRLRLDAEGLPIVRAGLWEEREQSDGEAARITQRCLTRAIHGDADQVLSLVESTGCAKSRTADRQHLKVVSTCDLGGGRRQVSDYEYRGDPTEYLLVAEVSVSHGGKASAISRVRSQGRWLRECPEDMVPGDILEFGG
jgi:hypothetical protein